MTQPRIMVLAILMVAGLITSCESGWNASAEERLERAKSHLAQQDINSAVIELKNILQSEPDHREARLLLGKTYLKLGDVASAEKELSRAQQLGAVEPEVQISLAQALLEQQKYEPLHTLELPAGASDEMQAQWRAIKAEALLAQGKPDEAEGLLREALEIRTDSAPAMLGMARIAAAKQDFSGAREQLNGLLVNDEKYAPAWSLLGDIERTTGKLKEAEAAYTKAIENSLAHQPELIQRSLVRIALADYDGARADINKLKQQVKNHPLVNYAEGLLHFQQKRFAEAQTAFEEVLKVNSQYLPALFYGGATHLMLGHQSQAQEYLGRYVAHNPTHGAAQRLLAAAKLGAGNSAEAEAAARAALAQSPDDIMTLNLLANALMRQNKGEESVQYLQKVVAAQPDSAEARARLGLGLLGQGEQEGGVDELQKALELNPQLAEAGVRLVMTYVQQGELDQALEAAEKFRAENAGRAVAHVLLGAVHFTRQEMEQAATAFGKALEVEPDNLSASNGLAAVALQAREPEKAKQYYLEGLAKHPGHLQTLLALARVEALLGNRQGMEKALQEAKEKNPKAIEPPLYLGRLYMRLGEMEQAFAMLSEAKAEHAGNLAVQAFQAEYELAAGQFAAAKATLTDLDKASPDNAQLHFMLARAYEGLGEREQLRAELDKSVALSPSYVPARIALARLLIQERQPDEAEKHLQALQESPAANSAEVFFLSGQVAALKGDLAKAAEGFQQAFDQVPNSQTLLWLSRSRWAAGSQAPAYQQLKDWVGQHPEDLLIQFELGQRAIELKHNDDAIKAFTVVVENAPKNVMALNNLAWLLHKEEPAKALEYAQQANALAPEAFAVLDTLAVVQLANGDVAQAERSIGQALAKSPGQPSLMYHRAMILEAAGRKDEAITDLKAILGQEQPFPERAEAEGLLQRLGGS